MPPPPVQNFRHVVSVQAYTVTARNSRGEEVRSWATVATRRADIQPLSARELFAAQQAGAEATHKVRLRYFGGLTTRHRLLFGSRTFQVESVITPGEVKHWQELVCKEVV